MGRGVKVAAILVVILGITAAVVLGVFQIRSIDVKGNERYLAEQIRDDLIYDFKTRNTLYFSWKYRSEGPAEDAPYLASVHATMLSPTSVRIEVKENQIIGRLQYEGQNVYFDADGTVQEISDTIYAGIPLVAGVEIEKPQLYQKLVMNNASVLRTMLNITQLLIKNELIPDSVTFDGSQNMILRIGPVEVLLGQDEYLEEKIANLVSIYPQIEGTEGTLNMEGVTGKNEAISFKEKAQIAEPETGETEIEGSAAGGQAGSDILAGEGAGAEPAQENADNAGAAGSDVEGYTGENAGELTGEAGAEAAVENTAQEPAQEEASSTPFMVFDSSGTLRYDAHVSNGQVVDSYGNVIDGCYVNEKGNVIDAYMNEIDPATGTLAQ